MSTILAFVVGAVAGVGIGALCRGIRNLIADDPWEAGDRD